MSDRILEGLQEAWGLEKEADATKLPGLLSLSEKWLEDGKDPSELVVHFDAMRNQLISMQRAQAAKIDSEGAKLEPRFLVLVKQNLSDMESVELALELIGEAAVEGNLESCWDSLGELEEASEGLRESGEDIQDFLKSSPLICTGCASVGEEHTCPKCGSERLTLDPEAPAVEENSKAASVPLLKVFHFYEAVQAGHSSLAELSVSLSELQELSEHTQEEAQSLMDGSKDEQRVHAKAGRLIRVIDKIKQGIDMMESVKENRSTKTLNSGWRRVFDNGILADDIATQLRQE